jgi:TonB family protein
MVMSGPCDVEGSMRKEDVRRIVHRHEREIEFCYVRALGTQPDLEGRLEIKFVISGSGAVESATVEKSMGAEPVDRCIAQAVRRWTFPQPEDSKPVTVTYRIRLECDAPS